MKHGRHKFNKVCFLRVRAFIALFAATLLGIGGVFIVDCVAVETDHEALVAMHFHEDMSAPQKHSPYADHNESSHIHVYEIDVQAIIESFQIQVAPAHSVAIEQPSSLPPSQLTSQVVASQRSYFALQHLQLPHQYKTSIHPNIIILI